MSDVALTVKNLEKRGFSVRRFGERRGAAAYLLADIGDRAVGIGGSVTMGELGIYAPLLERGPVYWHMEQDPEEAIPKAAAAPVYLMSANGVSQSGTIINIDGRGNRAANMCYGHEKLYIVVGINKIAPDDETAMWRARNVAAPKNTRRLKKRTPCTVGEELRCYDCKGEERICRLFVTMDRPPLGIETVEVVIVDEALGY